MSIELEISDEQERPSIGQYSVVGENGPEMWVPDHVDE